MLRPRRKLTMLSPMSIAAEFVGVHWLRAAFGAGAEHLFRKKFGSFAAVALATMFAKVSCIKPPPTGFGVRMFRESVAGPVIRVMRSSACHWMVGLTFPVFGSMVCANIFPDQVLVWY